MRRINLSKLHKDARGGIVIIVAMAFPVILLFIALVADIGMFHVSRAQLQTMADAASLAGVTYTDDEMGIDQASRRTVGENAVVDVHVALNSERAATRARAAFEANLEHLLGNISIVGQPSFYLPAGGGGNRVIYHVTIAAGDTNWVLYSMDHPLANTYAAEVNAEVNTMLLGSLLSVFHGQPGRQTLPVRIYSRSGFVHR